MPRDDREEFTRESNVFDLDMFRIFARRLPEGNSSPVFLLHLINGNPRFKVFTNCPTDRNGGKIEFKMDAIIFNLFLSGMKKIIDGGTEPVSLTHEDYVFYDKQRSENPVELARLVVDYDSEEEKYFIAILAKNRPKIKFYFRTPIRHNIYLKGGDRVDSKTDSLAYMTAYYDILNQLIGPAVLKYSADGLKLQEKRKEDYKRKKEEEEKAASGSGHTPSSSGGFNYD